MFISHNPQMPVHVDINIYIGVMPKEIMPKHNILITSYLLVLSLATFKQQYYTQQIYSTPSCKSPKRSQRHV